eukprot:scaffold51599_cov17-Tisochrysis_lutea.AAC.1
MVKGLVMFLVQQAAAGRGKEAAGSEGEASAYAYKMSPASEAASPAGLTAGPSAAGEAAAPASQTAGLSAAATAPAAPAAALLAEAGATPSPNPTSKPPPGVLQPNATPSQTSPPHQPQPCEHPSTPASAHTAVLHSSSGDQAQGASSSYEASQGEPMPSGRRSLSQRLMTLLSQEGSTQLDGEFGGLIEQEKGLEEAEGVNSRTLRRILSGEPEVMAEGPQQQQQQQQS